MRGVLDPFRGLKAWKKPEVEWKNFAASDFATFLPQDGTTVTAGLTYPLTGQCPSSTEARDGRVGLAAAVKEVT